MHELCEGHGGAGIDLVVRERNVIRLSDCLVCLWEEMSGVGVGKRVESRTAMWMTPQKAAGP